MQMLNWLYCCFVTAQESQCRLHNIYIYIYIQQRVTCRYSLGGEAWHKSSPAHKKVGQPHGWVGNYGVELSEGGGAARPVRAG